MPHPESAAHITIVAHDIGPVGGMEIQISRLIEGLLARGRRVTVIARTCDVEAHDHLTLLRVPSPRGPFIAFYPWFAAVAGALLARRASGIVHVAGAIVPNAIDVASVHFCHHAFNALAGPSRASRDTVAHRAHARAAAALGEQGERLVYRPERVRATVAISDGVRREVEHWFPRLRETIRTIPHGVDQERFAPSDGQRARVRRELGIPRHALVAILVGGDWARKGLAHAIHAVAAAGDWRLVVVGEGDVAAYSAVATAAGAGDRVYFVGTSADTPSQFAAADTLLLPTNYETFSLVTYEAAAAGLPLLVTKVSGPDQLIRPGVNGAFLNDSTAHTVKWLERLRDAGFRAAMGAAARRAVAPYTWEAATDRHVALYDELARTGVGCRPEA